MNNDYNQKIVHEYTDKFTKIICDYNENLQNMLKKMDGSFSISTIENMLKNSRNDACATLIDMTEDILKSVDENDLISKKK